MIKSIKKLWKSICKGYMPKEEVLVLKKQVKPKKVYKKIKRLRSR